MDKNTMILIITSVNVILLILNPLGLSIWNSYLAERGKGLATKKDIRDITTEVKKVESMFSIMTSSEIDYNSLKRKAILEFYESLNTWSSLILADVYYYEKDRLDENKLLLQKIWNSNVEAFTKFENLFIFIPRDPFEDLAKNAFEKLSNMEEGLAALCKTLPTVYQTISDEENAASVVKDLLINYAQELLPQVHFYREDNKLLIEQLDIELKNTFKKQGA
ncbi:hypothetical protein [Elizabethkingia anophelis]|uniref:hypothetical protein n=1 Tax=Elizabethkingia anophelis TaxID=1117645 RepID=UPI00162A81B9|nr:hypothetical protein [Elizabethkingia anophelis]MCT4321818.1 hypothetical protein [Elizabethkingia anophelis]